MHNLSATRGRFANAGLKLGLWARFGLPYSYSEPISLRRRPGRQDGRCGGSKTSGFGGGNERTSWRAGAPSFRRNASAAFHTRCRLSTHERGSDGVAAAEERGGSHDASAFWAAGLSLLGEVPLRISCSSFSARVHARRAPRKGARVLSPDADSLFFVTAEGRWR